MTSSDPLLDPVDPESTSNEPASDVVAADTPAVESAPPVGSAQPSVDRSRRGWKTALVIVGTAAAVAGVVALVVTGWTGLSDAHRRIGADLATAEHRLAVVDRGVLSGTTAASDTQKIAAGLRSLDLSSLADANSLAALGKATASADTRLTAAAKQKHTAVDGAQAGLFWPWDILVDSERMKRGLASTNADAAESRRTITGLRDSAKEVEKSGLAVATEVGKSLPSVLGAYPSARNTARDELHRASDVLRAPYWDSADTDVASYLHAVDDLRSTQEAELAEKHGPLLANRQAAEEFARSISGGVMLDFDWADIVIGYGDGDSMAGTAQDTWYTPDEVYSTITLTNSVAALWNDGSDRSQSLVAHEVGHAIHPKCFGIYPDDEATEELWATAWSISWGHTSDANGTQAYGRPADSLIATAATCR